MKSKILSLSIAAGLLFSGVSTIASAEWSGDADALNWKSTKPRAEVISELKFALENGGLAVGENPEYPDLAQPVLTRTRDEVHAEAVKAVSQGYDVNSIYFGD